MSDIFLSYSQKDEARVRPIVRHLESLGWSVFWDQNIPVGKDWDEYIEQHLNDSLCVVVVWSKRSVNSRWVKTEARAGMKRNILIPVKIDQVEPPFGFDSIQAADLTGWKKDAGNVEFGKCINSIAAIVPTPVKSKPIVKPSIPPPPRPKPQLLKWKNFTLVWGMVPVVIVALISWLVFGLGYSPKQDTFEGRTPVFSMEQGTTAPPTAAPLVTAAPVETPASVAAPVVAQKPSTPATETVQAVVSKPSTSPRIPENFVLIKGNTFMMGSPESEVGHQNNEIQHKVKLSDFAICKYEVTVGEYLKFARDTKKTLPDDTEVGDRYPVVNVSWNDAMAYCKWLTKKRTNGIYRLPTEAEWEYTCRAETATPFNTGENLRSDQANYNGIYSYRNYSMGVFLGKTVPVDSFQPNGFRLYNMHGNVWEWCSDWYGEGYYEECLKQGVVSNPQGPALGSYRVLRGGSWNDDASGCRSAYRYSGYPGYHFNHVGFRLVFIPQSKS